MAEKERGKENLEKRFFPGFGKYEIPEIRSCESYTAQNFISFNNALTEKNRKHKGLHFFVDDYQFERLWLSPERYVSLFQSYDCICSPDFSIYADYPFAMQIYNHYRKMWLSLYYQEYGISVVPTVCWGDDRSFEFCFDGMPVDSVVACSNTGCVHGEYQKTLFMDGFEKMINVLEPKEILFYGQKSEFVEDFGIKITYIGDSHSRFVELFD